MQGENRLGGGNGLAVGFGHAVVPAGKGLRHPLDCLGEGFAPPGCHGEHFGWWSECRKQSRGDVEVEVEEGFCRKEARARGTGFGWNEDEAGKRYVELFYAIEVEGERL